jgi:hypothetical protein
VSENFKAKLMYGMNIDEMPKEEAKASILEELKDLEDYAGGAYLQSKGMIRLYGSNKFDAGYIGSEYTKDITEKEMALGREKFANLFSSTVKSDVYVKQKEIGDLKKKHDINVLINGNVELTKELMKQTEQGMIGAIGESFINHFTSISKNMNQ